MRLGSMLGDIVRSFFKKPITEMYPVNKQAAPSRLRGELIYHPRQVHRMPAVREGLPFQGD